MNVSEKLKEVQPIHLSVGDPPVNQWDLYDLPLAQIVAVIEAAEDEPFVVYWDVGEAYRSGRLTQALAALEKALQ